MHVCTYVHVREKEISVSIIMRKKESERHYYYNAWV